VAPGLQVRLAGHRRPGLLHVLGHVALDPRLQARLQRAPGDVVGLERDGDPRRVQRRPQRAIALVQLGLGAVGVGDGVTAGGAAVGQASAAAQRDDGGQHQQRPAGGHLSGSAANVFRFFLKSSSVISE